MTEKRTHAAQIEAQGNDNNGARAQLAGMIADPATQREPLHRPDKTQLDEKTEIEAIAGLLGINGQTATTERMIGAFDREGYLSLIGGRIEIEEDITRDAARVAAGVGWALACDYLEKRPELERSEAAQHVALDAATEVMHSYCDNSPETMREQAQSLRECYGYRAGERADEFEEDQRSEKAVAAHIAKVGEMKAAAFDNACEAKEDSNFRDFMRGIDADAERLQITPKAAGAINQLATILPAVDREPSEADVTRHMMTGEEPRSWTVDDVKAHRREHGGKKATQKAAERFRDAGTAHRNAQHRDHGPEL